MMEKIKINKRDFNLLLRFAGRKPGMAVLVLFSALFLLPAMTPGVQAQYELEQYLITAAQNNPGLKAKFNAYMAGMEKVPQVGGLPDMSFAFGYFIRPVETRYGPQRAKLSIAQTFPWFGLLSTREDAATENARALYEAFEESKSKLYYEVRSTYYELYFVQRSIEISLENIDILNTLYQLTLVKIESGTSSLVDGFRVEMDLNDIKNQLALLRDTENEIRIRFNRLLNVPDNSPIVVPDELWQDNVILTKEAMLDSISSNNHEIRQIDHRITAWEKTGAAAQKAFSPNIQLGFDYIFVGTYENPGLTESQNGRDAMFARLGVTIPLYGKKYKGLIKESTLQMEKEGYLKDDKINRLSVVFEGVYKNYRDALRRVDLYLTQYGLANQSLNILMEQYASDGKNFVEVLRMQRKLLEYELKLDRARTDVNAAVAFIDYMMGH